MGRNLHHCSGCLRMAVCKQALWPGSENCELYVRNSYYQCHKCLRFGQECQRSGLIKCDFQPRITEDAFAKLNEVKREIDD